MAPAIDGFCVDDVKVFGPVHAYVAPGRFDALRFNVDPAQIGVLLDAVGAAGVVFTVTAIVTGVLAQPLFTMQV